MEEELVTVWITNYLNALILKSRLESEGIPVMLGYTPDSIAPGELLSGGLAFVSIKVPSRFAEEARRILEEIGI
jgi:hypothetical protein